MSRPNVLFIMTDQQRYDAISCREGSVAQTPNIDTLAAQGVRFEHCYSQCPLCVPSRMSMLTGQYTHTHRTIINEDPHDETIPTWAGALGEIGYQRVAVGKTHGVHRGFDRVPPPYGCEYDRGSGGAKWPHGLTVGKSEQCLEEHFDYLTATQAIEQMTKLKDADAPWAMHVGIFSPHPPFMMPEPFDTLYNPSDICLPDFTREQLDSKTLGQRNMHDRYFDVPDEKLQRMIAGYYACVTLADYCIGRVLDSLDSLGLASNTLVIVVSDHGEMRGEHGLFSKFSSAYDDEVRVPLILRMPGVIAPNTVNHALVETIDITSTILEYCQCPVYGENQGISLLPMLRGETTEHRSHVHSLTGFLGNQELRPYGMMIRTKSHKLVFYPNDTCELYDMIEDPHEHINRYDDPAFSKIKRTLERQLLTDTINTQALPCRHLSVHNER